MGNRANLRPLCVTVLLVVIFGVVHLVSSYYSHAGKFNYPIVSLKNVRVYRGARQWYESWHEDQEGDEGNDSDSKDLDYVWERGLRPQPCTLAHPGFNKDWPCLIVDLNGRHEKDPGLDHLWSYIRGCVTATSCDGNFLTINDRFKGKNPIHYSMAPSRDMDRIVSDMDAEFIVHLSMARREDLWKQGYRTRNAEQEEKMPLRSCYNRDVWTSWPSEIGWAELYKIKESGSAMVMRRSSVGKSYREFVSELFQGDLGVVVNFDPVSMFTRLSDTRTIEFRRDEAYRRHMELVVSHAEEVVDDYTAPIEDPKFDFSSAGWLYVPKSNHDVPERCMDKKKFCWIMKCRVSDQKLRDEVRKYFLEGDQDIIFVLGTAVGPEKDSQKEKKHRELDVEVMKEAKKYNDIAIYDAPDRYQMLRFKMRRILEFHVNSTKSGDLMTIDADMIPAFANIDEVVERMKDVKAEMSCLYHTFSSNIIWRRGTYQMDWHDAPGIAYPVYCSGRIVWHNREASRNILRAIDKDSVFKVNGAAGDALIYGMARALAGVNPPLQPKDNWRLWSFVTTGDLDGWERRNALKVDDVTSCRKVVLVESIGKVAREALFLDEDKPCFFIWVNKPDKVRQRFEIAGLSRNLIIIGSEEQVLAREKGVADVMTAKTVDDMLEFKLFDNKQFVYIDARAEDDIIVDIKALLTESDKFIKDKIHSFQNDTVLTGKTLCKTRLAFGEKGVEAAPKRVPGNESFEIYRTATKEEFDSLEAEYSVFAFEAAENAARQLPRGEDHLLWRAFESAPIEVPKRTSASEKVGVDPLKETFVITQSKEEERDLIRSAMEVMSRDVVFVVNGGEEAVESEFEAHGDMLIQSEVEGQGDRFNLAAAVKWHAQMCVGPAVFLNGDIVPDVVALDAAMEKAGRSELHCLSGGPVAAKQVVRVSGDDLYVSFDEYPPLFYVEHCEGDYVWAPVDVSNRILKALKNMQSGLSLNGEEGGAFVFGLGRQAASIGIPQVIEGSSTLRLEGSGAYSKYIRAKGDKDAIIDIEATEHH